MAKQHQARRSTQVVKEGGRCLDRAGPPLLDHAWTELPLQHEDSGRAHHREWNGRSRRRRRHLNKQYGVHSLLTDGPHGNPSAGTTDCSHESSAARGRGEGLLGLLLHSSSTGCPWAHPVALTHRARQQPRSGRRHAQNETTLGK